MTDTHYYTIPFDSNQSIGGSSSDPTEIFVVDVAALTADNRHISLSHQNSTPAGAIRHIQCNTTGGFRRIITDLNSSGTVLTEMVSGQIATFVYDKDNAQWRLWNGSHRSLPFGQFATLTQSNGLELTRLELIQGRNMDSTCFGPTPGSGKFAVRLSYPGGDNNYYLVGEAAKGNTKTHQAYWEYTLPQNYYGQNDLDSTSGNLTFTVTASYEAETGAVAGTDSVIVVDARQCFPSSTLGDTLVSLGGQTVKSGSTTTSDASVITVDTTDIAEKDYIIGPGTAAGTHVVSIDTDTDSVIIHPNLSGGPYSNVDYTFFSGANGPVYPYDADFPGLDFAVEGSTLAPGARLLLVVTVTVQETTGNYYITPQLSGVRLR